MSLVAETERLNTLQLNTAEQLRGMLRISERDWRQILRVAKTPDELLRMLQAWVSSDVLITPKTQPFIDSVTQNIGTAYQIGVLSGNKPPSTFVELMKQAVTDSSMTYIKKLDDEIKNGIRRAINLSFTMNTYGERRVTHTDLVDRVNKSYGIGRNRMDMIARTEIMNAANLGSWSQAKAEGSKYFTVESRPACCKYCNKYYRGRVFSIDDAQYLPPFHPRCACVAVFHDSKRVANEYLQRSDNIHDTELRKLKDKGLKIPDNGTGPLLPDVKRPARYYYEPRGRSGPVLKKDMKRPPRGGVDPDSPVKNHIEFYDKYKTALKEHGVVLDKNGNVLKYYHSNNKSSVQIDLDKVRDKSKIDRVLHNHPSASDWGGASPLSDADIGFSVLHQVPIEAVSHYNNKTYLARFELLNRDMSVTRRLDIWSDVRLARNRWVDGALKRKREFYRRKYFQINKPYVRKFNKDFEGRAYAVLNRHSGKVWYIRADDRPITALDLSDVKNDKLVDDILDYDKRYRPRIAEEGPSRFLIDAQRESLDTIIGVDEYKYIVKEIGKNG